MDARGQISLELVLVVGLIFVIVMGIAGILGEDNELNQAMGAARSGAEEGSSIAAYGFSDNSSGYTLTGNTRLLGPTSIKIINVNYTQNNTNIQLGITASAPTVTNTADKTALGNVINFYVRKSICESFGTNNDSVIKNNYDPAYSNRYVIRTASVTWI